MLDVRSFDKKEPSTIHKEEVVVQLYLSVHTIYQLKVRIII